LCSPHGLVLMDRGTLHLASYRSISCIWLNLSHRGPIKQCVWMRCNRKVSKHWRQGSALRNGSNHRLLHTLARIRILQRQLLIPLFFFSCPLSFSSPAGPLHLLTVSCSCCWFLLFEIKTKLLST
jgi:hypothetical protein